jgi:very-short-patch-repair endonuclease
VSSLSRHEPAADDSRRRILDQLEIWRTELIDFGKRNRLLYFKHTKSSTLEIRLEPDQIGDLVQRLLSGVSLPFYFPPQPLKAEDGGDATDETPEVTGDVPPSGALVTSKADARSLGNALRLLDRRSTQDYMDKGIWILYLAVGVLRWVDNETDESAESPLILIPVELHRESPRDPFELRHTDEDVALNPALTVRMEEYGVELPPIDGDDFDLEILLTHVEKLVADRPGWELQRRLILSVFSFHKEAMFRDLLNNEEEIADHELIQALSLGAQEGSPLDFDPVDEDRLDDDSPPELVATILDADATQRQCIAAAEAGHSFVMDGPPGSGKSQTIANLIAQLLAKGKTVLFVSEKAAALEVVQKRLRAAGLGDYTLELHSHKAARKEVALQLGASLGLHPAAHAPMTQADVSKLILRRTQLSARAAAMNEIRRPLGRSLHQVIGRIAQLQPLPQAPPPDAIDAGMSAESLSHILITADELARAWGPVERGDEFLWRELNDVSLNAGRQQRTAREVDVARSRLRALVAASTDAAEALLRPVPTDFSGALALARVLRQVEMRHVVPESWLTEDSLDQVEGRYGDRCNLAKAHHEFEQSLTRVVGDDWRELDPAASNHLNEAVATLQGLMPRFDVASESSNAELRQLHQFVASGADTLDSVRQDAVAVAIGFGLPTGEITFSRADGLAELALLAEDGPLPEPHWLDPVVVKTVRQAMSALQPLCATVAERREVPSRTFSDDVLALDLTALVPRFGEVHTGLGKLKGAYRADKATVAQVTHSGKADKTSIALLPAALEWQNSMRELDAAEQIHSQVLGSHYYRGYDSDFDAIDHALETAERALEIVRREPSSDALRRQLGRGSSAEPELLRAGHRIVEISEQWRRQAEIILGSFAPVLVAMDLESVIAWCAAAADPLGRITGIADAVERLSVTPIAFGETESAAAARTSAAVIEGTFAAEVAPDRELLGASYDGLITDWELLGAQVEWAAALRTAVGARISPAAAQRIQTLELRWAEVDDAFATWGKGRDAVLAHFHRSRRDELQSDLETTFDDADELLALLAETVGDIDEWVDHQNARTRLEGLHLGEVVEFCVSERVSAEALPRIMERACLERWADTAIAGEPDRLGQLRADQLDPIADEFRELDIELIGHAGGRVIDACNARRPRTTLGAAGIIKREFEKRRKHMPVHKLLGEAAEVAQALKPCFMMSPLTVSRLLPPTLKFDVVVFDEASQVRPSDAINCVYRGAQLIVAGDQRQLPPTSFFEVGGVDDGEWEEEQFEEFESILQLCKGSGGLRELPLKWHYRSQHEDLITYSNQSFYDGRLVTFPGAAHEADDLGVKFFYVADGVYRRGSARDNPREAEVVVDRVMHWARESLTHPEREFTLGVVAFSEAQASAIEVALDRRRQGSPELDAFFSADRLDGFFVKNLESVQGDERDVMLFSVGYGRDENGKLTMNFGPLNRDGGERRLNVAITRARRRVEVVSSVTGAEGEFNTLLKGGARHLQRYLDYAARGPASLALEIGESGLDAESPFEEEVIRTIRAWGYEVEPQVGSAGYRVDIGVKSTQRSGQFALGVECDGAMYHSSKVARDRDRLRQEVLERLGWRIHRIWGTAWYRNRPEQELRLRAAIEEAISGEAAPADQRRMRPVVSSQDVAFEAVALDEAPMWASPYEVADPVGPARHIEMHVPEAQADLRRMILEVVAVEGPVLDELVLQRVREAWGVGRAGHRIRDAFWGEVLALSRRGAIEDVEEGFLASAENQLTNVRVPGDEADGRRGVNEVPRAELKLAVLNLTRDAQRVSRDELTSAVARLFGWNRRGGDIAAALDAALNELVRAGEIVEDGEYLRAQ